MVWRGYVGGGLVCVWKKICVIVIIVEKVFESFCLKGIYEFVIMLRSFCDYLVYLFCEVLWWIYRVSSIGRNEWGSMGCVLKYCVFFFMFIFF